MKTKRHFYCYKVTTKLHTDYKITIQYYVYCLYIIIIMYTQSFWCTLSVYWQNKIFESLVNTHTEYLHIMLASH